MADVLEISRQQVSAWENGIKPISENRLRQLSKYFGLEEKYFLGISEEVRRFLYQKDYIEDRIVIKRYIVS